MLEGAPGNHFKAVHYFGMDSPLLLAVFFKKEWKQANEEGEFTFPFDKSASNLMWQGHIFYFRCFSVVTLLFVLPFLLSGCLQAAKSLCIYSFLYLLLISHFLYKSSCLWSKFDWIFVQIGYNCINLFLCGPWEWRAPN